ncbi:hypothetical protein [Ectopseudomonas oleovorans]|uniref:hypothetical protein n=1 Tax=Ectopseudomonas oleovorans TaxID=301 RepID=UPI003F1D5A76
MSGAGIRTNLLADPRLAGRLERLAQLDTTPLLEAIGAEVEEAKRRRIAVNKASPAGVLPAGVVDRRYAKTRHSGQRPAGGEPAGQHHAPGRGRQRADRRPAGLRRHPTQFGDDRFGIEQRELLGLEGDDLDDVVGLVEDYLEEIASD